jgi:hypothetical protein
MAVEVHDGGMTITGEHVEIYRLLSLIKAFDLEIRTGMKMRHGMSLTKIAKQYGATSRTKQGCRDYLANLYHQQTGNTI